MCKDSEQLNLPSRAYSDIIGIAESNQVTELILFGSRARGDNGPKSDIDLAVYGCRDFLKFSDDIENSVWTLLSFDLINMDQSISDELKDEIDRDGIVLYSISRN